MKKTILILTAYYLPGFKGGGPIKSIANIVEHLGDEFNFKIITSDRDLGDKEAYKNITLNTWVKCGKAEVIDLEPSKQNLKGIRKVINDKSYDLMYLTGYFSPIFTLIPIILRRLNMIDKKKVILAPRGEFSKGALENKRFKKLTFITLDKMINLYKEIYWHATTEYEKIDIKKVWGEKQNIYVANNLTEKKLHKFKNISLKEMGSLSCVFISRISPKKNITYALEVLKKINNVKIVYDIYGPIEDKEYWKECISKINELPKNIKVNYKGEIEPSNVMKKFSEYNVFLFPTMGENFGHAILEALNAGCAIVISDQTPWRDLEKSGVGFDIPLTNKNKFVDVLKYYASLNKESFMKVSNSVNKYLENFLKENKDVILTRDMFNDIS